MYEGENMTEDMPQTAPAATQAPATEQKESAELNINDLNSMKLIIDVASQRGAFKPNEMMLVGQTYNKLTTFLDTVAKQSQQATPPAGA
jgi:hypothetical protein